MTVHHRRWFFLACSVAVLAALSTGFLPGLIARTTEEPPADVALDRARDQVKMLDDLYKTAVVSITKRYVGKQDNEPAIKVAQDIFGAMKKQGWHSAKLVDATGEPMGDSNAPKTDFEKEAAQAMNSGKPYFERVIGEGKNRRLLAATVVPVVLEKCAECHNHKKLGDVLGFIRYDIPIK